MTLFDYYLQYMTELWEGKRPAPEGVTLPEGGDENGRIQALGQQLQAMGMASFVRACAAQDGTELPEELFKESGDLGGFEAFLRNVDDGAGAPEPEIAPEPDRDADKHAFEVLLDCIARELAREKTLAGVHVTVTAGPTQEALDPVRYLTNHSSGRMGYAIAREAALRGAEVTLISGPTALQPPMGVTVRPVVSAQDMLEAVQDTLPETDILIKAAAVADYRPATVSEHKMKKSDGELSIPLSRTEDILHWVSEHRHPGLFVCGFSMETRDMVANSQAKLEKKKVDMICANNLKVSGAGFGVDTNILTVITRQGVEELPLMGKEDAAGQVIDRAVALLGEG